MGSKNDENRRKLNNFLENNERPPSTDLESKTEELKRRSHQAFTNDSHSDTKRHGQDLQTTTHVQPSSNWFKQKIKGSGFFAARLLLYANVAIVTILGSDYLKIENNKEAHQIEISEKYAAGMAVRAPEDFAKLKQFFKTNHVPEFESKKIFPSWYDHRIVAQVGLDMSAGNSTYLTTFANCVRKDPEFLDDLCKFTYNSIAEGSKDSNLQPQITEFLLSLLDLPFVQQKFEEYAINAFVENPETRAAFLEKLSTIGIPLVEKLLNDPLTKQIVVNFGEATMEDIIQALNGEYKPKEGTLASLIRQKMPEYTQRGIIAVKNELAKHKDEILYGNKKFYAFSDGKQLRVCLTEASSGADLNKFLKQAHERKLSVNNGYIALTPMDGHIKLSIGGDVEVEYDLLDELINKIPFVAIAKEMPGMKTPLNMLISGLGGYLTGEKNYTLDGIINQAKKNQEPVDWRGAALRADFYAIEAKAQYIAHRKNPTKESQKVHDALRQYAARLYGLAADHTTAAEELRGLFTDKNQIPVAEEYARAFRKMQEDILDDDLSDVLPAGTTYSSTKNHRKIHQKYLDELHREKQGK